MSGDPVAIEVADPSQVSSARHAVQRLARTLEFDETRAGRAAIAATEAATNMLKHAGSGMFLARGLQRGGALGLEMIAVDGGPGMSDFQASARDGHSTAGTPGTGLGAMRRQSDELDVFTHPGAGTAVRMVLWDRVPEDDTSGYHVGVVRVPKPGETACGDAWHLHADDAGATLVVADGLGHGPDASRAAASAVDVLMRHPQEDALRLLDLAHHRLRPTRGAAVAFVRHPAGAPDVSFAGVGNIAACVLDGATRRAMVSHNGIVGHNVHKSVAYGYAWPVGALLVAHSDGLESQWDVAATPGLAAAHPSLIAAMLFRRHWRRRDDVVVVVLRRRT